MGSKNKPKSKGAPKSKGKSLKKNTGAHTLKNAVISITTRTVSTLAQEDGERANAARSGPSNNNEHIPTDSQRADELLQEILPERTLIGRLLVGNSASAPNPVATARLPTVTTPSNADVEAYFGGLSDTELRNILRQRLPTYRDLIPTDTTKLVAATWASTIEKYFEAKAMRDSDARKQPKIRTAIALLLLFPSTILSPDSRSSIALKERCRRWELGEILELRNEAIAKEEARLSAKAPSQVQSISDSALPEEDHPIFNGDGAHEEAHTKMLRRIQSLCRRGLFTQAMRAAEKEPLPILDSAKERAMLALHPSKSGSPSIPDDVAGFKAPEPLIVEVKLLTSIIRGLQNGKGAGSLTGWHHEHLKIFLASPSAMENLSMFMTDLINGDLPEFFYTLTRDSDLIGIPKPNAPNDVRPIALVEGIRNLGADIVMKLTVDDFRKSLEPTGQLAIGVQGGVEMVAHAARLLTDHYIDSLAMLDLDIVNFFNSCSRNGILDSVRRRAPKALPFVRAYLQKGGHLYLRVPMKKGIEEFAKSEQGTAQGEKVSMAVSCCLLADFVEALDEHLKNALDCHQVKEWITFGIVDDLRILGSERALRAAAKFILETCPPPSTNITPKEPYCMRTHPLKTRFFSRKGKAFFTDLDNDPLPFEVADSIKCLGTFLGSDTYIKEQCMALVESWRGRLQAIKSIADDLPNEALLLLRSCHSTRISHLLRTTPPELINDAVKAFDDMTKEAFLTIIDLPSLTDDEWKRVFAPPSMGGLGLFNAAAVAVEAYAGSLGLCLAGLYKMEKSWPDHFNEAVKHFNTEVCTTGTRFKRALAEVAHTCRYSHTRRKDIATLLGMREDEDPWRESMFKFPSDYDILSKSQPGLQRFIHKRRAALDLLKLTELTGSPTIHDKEVAAGILSATGKGAMAWTLGLPHKGLRFPKANFRAALLHWLGRRTPEEKTLSGMLCTCGKSACPEVGPSHMGFCSRAAGVYRIRRHNAVQDEVVAICREAGLRPSIEDRVAAREAPRDENDHIDHSRSDILIPDMLVDKITTKKASSTSGTTTTTTNIEVEIGTKRITTHLDIAICEPACTNGLVKGAASKRGAYAAETAKRKKDHYEPLLADGTTFYAAVLETHGLFDRNFVRFLRLLAEHATNTAHVGSGVTGKDLIILRRALVAHYMRRISTVLQLNVTKCIFDASHRLPYKLYAADPTYRLPDTHKLAARAQIIIGNAVRNQNSALALD